MSENGQNKTEEKKKVGRPGKYKAWMAERVLEQMSDGLSFEACCGDIGISKDTGYRWVKEIPEFAEAKEMGEVRGQLFWEKAAISGMWSNTITETVSKDDGKGKPQTVTTSSKFNSTIFIFIMKNRFGWRDRKEISGDLNLTGGFGDLDELYRSFTDEQVRREAADIVSRMIPKPEGPKRT